jgi:hypothetical protein
MGTPVGPYPGCGEIKKLDGPPIYNGFLGCPPMQGDYPVCPPMYCDGADGPPTY